MSKVVQYDGVLYSFSNRRLFVMRVVANLTRGGIRCRVLLLPGVAVVVLVLVCVYYNAAVAFHNQMAFNDAQRLLNWNDEGKREQR